MIRKPHTFVEDIIMILKVGKLGAEKHCKLHGLENEWPAPFVWWLGTFHAVASGTPNLFLSKIFLYFFYLKRRFICCVLPQIDRYKFRMLHGFFCPVAFHLNF